MIFIDSPVWFAIANRKDREQQRARDLLRVDLQRITTDQVMVETWLLINSRVGRQVAEDFWQLIREGGAYVEHVMASDTELAWRGGHVFRDQPFSLVDRTGFVVMERLGIVRAARFDHDLVVYRFGRKRERACEVPH